MPHAPAFWFKQTDSLPARLLAPLGWLYGQAARLHGACRARHPYYAAVPVISIGNLTVGGAGKTPVTAWLTGHFLKEGHTVAIVSRGYGGSETSQPTRVEATTHTAAQAGDEPLMLARTFARKPVQVWVGRNRPATVRRAEQAGATLILLDDGFQRRDVARTVDILVIDGTTAFGNNRPLPAGPLREFPTAIARAHFAIVLNEPESRRNRFYGLPAYRLTTGLAKAALAGLPPRPPVAFAGLARPDKFFESLRQSGLKPSATVAYADHHCYTETDLAALKALAAKHRAPLVTTEKDAVKLPPQFATALPLEVSGPDADTILAELATRLR